MYTVPTILINFVRSIRAVTFVCMIGNVFIFASIALILEVALLRFIWKIPLGTVEKLKMNLKELFVAEHNWRSLPWVTSFDGVVASAGSLLYSFEGQAMVCTSHWWLFLRSPQHLLKNKNMVTTSFRSCHLRTKWNILKTCKDGPVFWLQVNFAHVSSKNKTVQQMVHNLLWKVV